MKTLIKTRPKALVAVLPMLLLTLPAAVQAQFSYSTNNGTITITGYTGSGGAVTIPAVITGLPVTSIGDRVFVDHTSLTGITFPNGVTNIGDYAFYGCTNLTSITIPQSVTAIGEGAFGRCTRLTAITVDALNSAFSGLDGVLFNKNQTELIQYPGGKNGAYAVPNNVIRIGDSAFQLCAGLASVSIPNKVASIGIAAFAFCTTLTNVTIPDSVTRLGDSAYWSCTSLTSITIGNSVTNIGYYAFAICTSLTNVTIGNSVTGIGDEAFAECIGLTSIAIPDSVTNIGDLAFLGCTNVTNITIPRSVTTIGGQVFYRCPSLTAITVDALNPAYRSVDGVLFNKNQTTLLQCPQGKSGSYTVPNSISAIGDFAFSRCDSLTNITIGNSVSSIGGFAFELCTGLNSMVIPNSVSSIGNMAFYYCQRLTGIFFQGNAPSIGLSVFEGDLNCTIYYLPGSTGWGSSFGDGTTALWSLPYPIMLNNDSSFGPQTNGFGFTISWATNIPVVVEASMTPVNPIWSPVSTNALTGGSSYFSDPQWTNYPSRFYRLRSP